MSSIINIKTSSSFFHHKQTTPVSPTPHEKKNVLIKRLAEVVLKGKKNLKVDPVQNQNPTGI